MSLIEFIVSMQLNDFVVPPRQEISAAVDHMHQCQLKSDYDPDCAGIIDKIIQQKHQLGSPYVYIQ